MVIFILKVFMTGRNHKERRLESHFYNQRMLPASGVMSTGASSSRRSSAALTRCPKSASVYRSDVMALSSRVEVQRKTPSLRNLEGKGRGLKEGGELEEEKERKEHMKIVAKGSEGAAEG